jgi:M6 family metalloprotease-like protein
MLTLKRLIVFAVCIVIAGGAAAVVAPKDGGKMPRAYFDMKAKDPKAFMFQRAWVQKAMRIKRQREAFLSVNGPQAVVGMPQEYAVSGTIQVPVLLCEFANVPGPFDSVAVQNQLFDNSSGTVTEYYDEVSYGNLTMTGTVYDWATLSQNDTYYEGIPAPPDYCNGLCASGQMGQLLTETLDAKDPAVDFSQYDNDGPDGIPDSGDDDGFVDFVAFVHPEFGGECGGNNNLWSHQWVYSGWFTPSLPYETDDPAAGGGFIKVNEYTLMPVLDCDGASLNEIGVFCHEFGHALGLPDLYDTSGGSYGIGHWGIMGSGNWNTPSSPAHPCAWTRMEMGWVTPTDVDWQGGIETIDAIATPPGEVFRLGFTFDRFRRSDECVINGSYSLYCGLTIQEGAYRGWSTAALDNGYGNMWEETIEREFSFDGTTPVNFSYECRFDTEAMWDWAYTVIEVDGTESVLDAFTGVNDSIANHELSSYLSVLTPPATYKIKFRGVSDHSWSDEDGDYNSDCGMFVVDDVSVSGGGESYSTDFETYVDGWHQSPAENERKEYWLVENRQKIGYDAQLHGEGLLITHVDQTVAKSTMGNSGSVKGVFVEEADGQWHLRKKTNRGDAGDVYPGSSNNTVFDSTTTPTAWTNTYALTQIEVSGISPSGDPMTAFMRAGDPAPTTTTVAPGSIDNNLTAVDVAVTGDDIKHGATFYFTLGGGARSGPDGAPTDSGDIVATSIRWIDPIRIEGTINVYSKSGGDWDLVITNPDGQEYTQTGALHINQLVAAQLQQATIDVVGDGIRLVYVLHDREPGETIRLSRSLVPDARWTVIADDLQPTSDDEQRYEFVDDGVEPGRTYYYKLDVVSDRDGIRELHRGNATVPAGKLTLAQNSPNPFNPTTSISFYLPKRTKVRMEVYDIAGRLVTRLASGIFEAGPHRVEWNGTNAAGTPVGSGIYLYRMIAGKQMMSRKMMLLK